MVAEQVGLIDFQQVRIASLVTDIHSLLITTAHPDVRKNKIGFFLGHYYKKLSQVFEGLAMVSLKTTH